MAVLNKHKHGVPADAVYIGRGSKWGNPFVMRSGADRDLVCDQYEAWLEQQVQCGRVKLEELVELHGKDLVCYCAPKRCHGDTLTKAAAWAHAQLQTKGTAMDKEYKLIVAGGRDFDDYELLAATLMQVAEEAGDTYDISIVTGMAEGADTLAFQFASLNGVRKYEFPADWSRGKGAGFIRNQRMAEFADGLLAFWDGQSKGTAHMIKTMQQLGKRVHVVNYKPFKATFNMKDEPQCPASVPPWEGPDDLVEQRAAAMQ